jgi:hypothetical protein
MMGALMLCEWIKLGYAEPGREGQVCVGQRFSRVDYLAVVEEMSVDDHF